MAELDMILNNEELMMGLVEAETPEELGELFKAHNIALSEDLTIERAFELVKEQEDAELNENDLEDVSGGSITLATAIMATGAFVLAGMAICFIAGYAYQKYSKKSKKNKKK